MQSYKDKLRAFNNTPKYKSEVEFLKKLISSHHEDINFILDYGFGTGKLASELGADGFDVVNYNEFLKKDYYINEIPPSAKFYDVIYFMHSLAHIPNPLEVLKRLKHTCDATITVITPNAHWLIMQSNNEYKPDPTVVKHYTQTQLRKLFEESGYEVTLLGQFGEESNGVNERLFLQAR